MLAIACTKRGDAPLESAAGVGEETAPPDFRTPEEPKPPAVLKLAESYFATLTPEQRPNDPESARDNFVRCFFAGFTNYTGSMSGGELAGLEGFKAGQEFRRAHPDQVKETFESFGYVATEAEGVCATGFEQSEFKPRGKNSAERWWLSGMADTMSDLPEEQNVSERDLTIRINGFLSPKGSYGHLGLYDREFYATKISKADGG
jgi:hypothetical protein